MATSTEMMKGTVVPITLKLLSERAMYGYEILKEVNRRSENVLSWKEATLYPCLHRLEQQRLLSSEWQKSSSGRRRKYYSLTRRGEAELAVRVSDWQSLSEAVSGILCVPATLA